MTIEPPAPTLADESLIKTGYLYKKSHKYHLPSLSSSWQRRWFVLRPQALTYYHDASEYKTLHIIPTDDIDAVAPMNDKKGKREGVFAVFTVERIYYLQVPSEERGGVEEWVDAVRYAAARAQRAEVQEDGGSMVMGQRGRNGSTVSGLVESDTAVTAPSSITPGVYAEENRDLPHSHQSGGYMSNTTASSIHSLGSSPNSNHGYISPDTDNEPMATPIRPPGDPSHSAENVATIKRERRRTTSEEQENNKLLMQGYVAVHKTGPHLPGLPKPHPKRWVVLRGSSLAIYKDEEEYKALRIIPLHEIHDAVEYEGSKRRREEGKGARGIYWLCVITSEKAWRFGVPSEELLIRWLACFKAGIEARDRRAAMKDLQEAN
ncbi:hypothetical protein YB2330_005480 [Saitoella coloradoensis]